MGINTSPNNPWLLYGKLTKNYPPTESQESISQLHVGLYVDDLVFYSSNTCNEELFKNLIQDHTKVDFMGNIDYFSGTFLIGLHTKTEI